ncbi:MAG TPA: T9SS type A sorting domain-containing protein [Bacteroidia bacterium]|jgi:hypothetical protein
MKKQLLLLFIFIVSTVMYSQNWSAVGPGLNKAAGALFADTSSGFLYAGGIFDSAGTLPLNHIGYWDGSQWNAMGQGLNGVVAAINSYGGDIFAVGDFSASDTTAVYNIARWNGSNWLSVGGGLNAVGLALFNLNGSLFVSGNFTLAGGQPCKYIAEWDGVNWQSVDTNIVSTNPYETIMSMGSFENNLVIGGNFIAGGTANNIAILNSGTWQPLSTGTNSMVTSIRDLNTELVVTGFFSQAGSTSAICVAKWNGTSWIPFPAPTSSYVSSNTIVNGQLVFGGNVNSFMNGSVSSTCIASFDQSSLTWSGITTGIDNMVSALATMGNTLYAAGAFDTAGASPIKNIAKIDASTLGLKYIPTENTIEVFPNPFTGKLFIRTNFNDNTKLKIRIVDVLGREISPVIKFNSEGIEMDRGNLPNGIYFMQVWKNGLFISEIKLVAM